jgi:hypothetical protein
LFVSCSYTNGTLSSEYFILPLPYCVFDVKPEDSINGFLPEICFMKKFEIYQDTLMCSPASLNSALPIITHDIEPFVLIHSKIKPSLSFIGAPNPLYLSLTYSFLGVCSSMFMVCMEMPC